MPLFSFFRKKKKEKKDETPPDRDVSNHGVAEDVLKTSLAKSNEEPIKCVALEPSSITHRQVLNVTLVQGSSDSRPASQSASGNQQTQRISNRRNSLAHTIQEPQIANVQYVHRAPSRTEPPSTATASRLYPNLDQIGTKSHSSLATPKVIEVKQVKSLHDMFIEVGKICLAIKPNILYADTIEKKLEQLENYARIDMLATKNLTRKSIELEYNFDKELDVNRKYSHVQVYEKLHTFADVKNYRRRAEKSIKRNASDTAKTTPIFQSYRESFRCYKGQRNDIINCD